MEVIELTIEQFHKMIQEAKHEGFKDGLKAGSDMAMEIVKQKFYSNTKN